MIGSDLLSGSALLLTALVGTLSYRSSRKIVDIKQQANATDMRAELIMAEAKARKELVETLADQYERSQNELVRLREAMNDLSKKHDDYVLECEKDKLEFSRLIAKLEGQVEILTKSTMGATGLTGDTGEQGEQGEQGVKGNQGNRGKVGEAGKSYDRRRSDGAFEQAAK